MRLHKNLQLKKTRYLLLHSGVISGVLVVIGSDLDGHTITDSEKELITSITSAGGFVGAVIAGLLADKFGRKPTIWFASVLFTIGALIQATAYTIAQMTVGRFLIVRYSTMFLTYFAMANLL